jgi:hypothetical protein
MDINKLQSFLDNGINFYKEYLAATQKQLSVEKSGLSDEQFINLMVAESFYSGRLSSLEEVKMYINMFFQESSNAETTD